MKYSGWLTVEPQVEVSDPISAEISNRAEAAMLDLVAFVGLTRSFKGGAANGRGKPVTWADSWSDPVYVMKRSVWPSAVAWVAYYQEIPRWQAYLAEPDVSKPAHVSTQEINLELRRNVMDLWTVGRARYLARQGNTGGELLLGLEDTPTDYLRRVSGTLAAEIVRLKAVAGVKKETRWRAGYVWRIENHLTRVVNVAEHWQIKLPVGVSKLVIPSGKITATT